MTKQRVYTDSDISEFEPLRIMSSILDCFLSHVNSASSGWGGWETDTELLEFCSPQRTFPCLSIGAIGHQNQAPNSTNIQMLRLFDVQSCRAYEMDYEPSLSTLEVDKKM